jgi:hypothetical protein
MCVFDHAAGVRKVLPMFRRILPLSVLSAALAIVLAGTSSARAEDAKGSVSGKVLTAAGEAVKAPTGENAVAKVFVMKPEDAPAPAAGGGGGGGGGGAGGGGGRARIDTTKAVASGDIKDGAYKIEVPAGKYVLIAQVSGQGGGRGRANVEVAAGKDTATEIKLAARPARGGGGGGAGGAAPQ